MIIILRLGLGLGKLRYHTGGPGGLPPGLGLGKLRNHTGGPGGLPPGFGLGKLRNHTGFTVQFNSNVKMVFSDFYAE